MTDFVQLWVYLASSPLFGLTATLVTYVIAASLYERMDRAPWANPVLWSIVVLGTLLVATHTPYPAYFAGAQFIHVLLGPAVVALAWPLWLRRTEIRRFGFALAIAALVGGAAAAGSAVALGYALGLPDDVVRSLAPKSVTAPVAMGIAERIGGVPALSAMFAVVTGLVGAMSAKYLFTLMRIDALRIRGIRVGHCLAWHRCSARNTGRRRRRCVCGNCAGAPGPFRGVPDPAGLRLVFVMPAPRPLKPVAQTHLTHVTTGAVFTMIAAVLCMSLLDAISKYLVKTYPAPFIVWLRYCLQTLILVAIWGPRLGRRLVMTQSLRLQVLRGVLLVLSSLMMVLGFRSLPLAEATAINFAQPSIVAILAIVFLKERMSAVRLCCVVAGMAGVLLIAQPGSEAFQGAAVFPSTAAIAAATYQVLTRKLAGDDARTLLFYASIVGAIAMSFLMPWKDVPAKFDTQALIAIGVVGVLAATGHFLFIRALQSAPASGLASITYVQLVFAAVIGYFLFGDFPTNVALAGILVIMISGCFLTWYERRRATVPSIEPPATD